MRNVWKIAYNAMHIYTTHDAVNTLEVLEVTCPVHGRCEQRMGPGCIEPLDRRGAFPNIPIYGFGLVRLLTFLYVSYPVESM